MSFPVRSAGHHEQRESQPPNQNQTENAKSITEQPVHACSINSLIHESDRPFSQQLGVWRKPSANIIIILVLANEATNFSKGWAEFGMLLLTEWMRGC